MSCGKPCACPSYREHLLSVSISGVARGVSTVVAQDRADMHMAKDMESYKRLRANGLQPPQVRGSYLIEKTQTPIELPA